MKRWGRWLVRGAGLGLLLLGSVSAALTQAADCPAFVEQAIDKVSTRCGAVGRNQVCYGNDAIDAEFATSVTFALPGDRAGVRDLRHLTTAPLLPETGTWGVAVLALQADLPDNLPGENATFIVFGDTELTPADAPAGYSAPMQAFNLTTRIGGIDCAEVPDSGLLVQAPEETTVNFLINGVEVSVGSSALLQVDGADLTVDTIEGFVQVTAAGATEVAGEGVSVRVPRGRRPLRAALTRSLRVRNAPWRLLPRQVRANPPRPDGQTVDLNACFYASARRAASNPVSVRAGEPLVLRFTIPEASLEIARVIQRRASNQLSINGVATPPYTRIGPWRGDAGQFGDYFGIEFYWLIDGVAAGTQRIELESRSLTGRPIHTGVDGPDADSEPDVIPALRRVYCAVQAG